MQVPANKVTPSDVIVDPVTGRRCLVVATAVYGDRAYFDFEGSDPGSSSADLSVPADEQLEVVSR